MSRVRLLGPAAVLLAAAAVVPAAPARAEQRLVTVDVPSRFVDVTTAVFNGERPAVLRANVLLPDGYDADDTRRWPVLYLLHGVGDSFDTWAKPANGDILRTAKDFPGIIVMPEAGRGFYTDWFNGGERGDPGWERYYTGELIGQIARSFRIAPGRANHAIAGLSMGGMGAAYIGGQRPDYFGTVATFSGFVQHQRETVKAGFGAVAGVDYEQIFGPINGSYASGHNPTRLAANLTETPVFAATGNGTAEPGVESSPNAVAGGGAIEAEIHEQNEEFAAALRGAGVTLDYRPGLGVHDWPYWRRYLAEAIAWGVFRADAVDDPPAWTYATIAARGRMWSLRYRFAEPPSDIVSFQRDGATLRGQGAGRVRLRDIATGCAVETELPFERPLSLAAADATCGRLRVRVDAGRPRAGRVSAVAVVVTRVVRGGGAFPVADAVVRVGRSSARTDAAGRATLRHRFARYAGPRRVRVRAPGLGSVRVRLRVR